MKHKECLAYLSKDSRRELAERLSVEILRAGYVRHGEDMREVDGSCGRRGINVKKNN